MLKILILLSLIAFSFLFAKNKFIEEDGVSLSLKDKEGKPYEITVKRVIPTECKKLPINSQTLWSGNYAHISVPLSCKSTYVHTKGRLFSMKLDEDVETYGEIEVLLTLKEMKTNADLLLVDSRKKESFNYLTIPGAINLPFNHFKFREEYEFEFEDGMELLGAMKDKKGVYDFDNAKTIVIFCNGPWCAQSPDMIFTLMKIGYPTEKLKWYRGGIQDWLSVGMTTARGNK